MRVTQLAASLNLQALSLAEGARAALSVAVIIALNEYFHWPPLIEAALAALNTCMCDPGGPIRRRVPVLLAYTLLSALVVAGFTVARGWGIAVALPLGVFGLFCATFVRIYGETPQLMGVLLGVMLILSLDRGAGLTQAGLLALFSIGGGLWATLLTMVIWRIYPDRPARQALSDVYRALSEVAGSLHDLLAAGETREAMWDAHAKTRLGGTRAAIETARDAVTAMQRRRGGAGEAGRHAMIRLEASDQLLVALVALGEALQDADPQQRRVAQAVLDRLQRAQRLFAQAIVTDSAVSNSEIEQAIAAIASEASSLPVADPVRSIIEQIIERLRIAYTLAVPANFLPGAAPDGTPPPLRQRLLQPLRANLDWRSPAFRHALRLATAAAPALAFTMLWFTPYDHWLTITIVMTMQPYFGLTYTRVWQRIAGTVVGGLVASLVGILCPTPAALAVAMFPLATVTLAARTLSYGLFITWLTPLVVLLVDMSLPGTSGWEVAGIRALFTLLGGGIAVAACFLLWPNFEPQRLLQEMRAAIAAGGHYVAAALSALVGDEPAEDAARARREGGVAINSLEASIGRALIEPAQRPRAPLQAAMLIDAALRRCAGRATAIMLDPTMRTAMPQPAWRSWRDWIARSSTSLAAGVTRLEPRPTPAIEAVSRIGRQFELIAGALERLPG